MKTTHTSTYTVTVRHEDKSPQSNITGQFWVARDKDGAWRTYGQYGKAWNANNAIEAAAGLFHADEIETITNNHDGTATVRIDNLAL